MTLLAADLAKLWQDISPRALDLSRMTPAQQANLRTSLQALDRDLLKHLRKAAPPQLRLAPLLPLQNWLSSDSADLAVGGRHLLGSQNVGILLLAGGQGSRLGKDVPKGMLPLSNVLGRSLFQIFAEKVAAAQELYNSKIPLAVLTSSTDLERVLHFFQDRNYWGLNPEQVYFCAQSELPVLSSAHDPLIGVDGKVVYAPDGNGSAFHAFVKSGIASEFAAFGVTHLSVQPIDNPLSDLVHPALLGTVVASELANGDGSCPLCFKAIRRLETHESLGVFAHKNTSLRVAEYSEVDLFEGQLKGDFKLCNTGEFCISMKTAMQMADTDLATWPLHLAKKSIPSFEMPFPQQPNALKVEYFNFDMLEWIEGAKVMLFDRIDAFAPLKENGGLRGPKGVRAAMLKADQGQFKRVTGQKPPNELFELPASWYYPAGAKSHGTPIYKLS